MSIDLESYVRYKIGSISWAGETNHDNQSSENMIIMEAFLLQFEDFYIRLLNELVEHKNYREGNASAIHLHKKAKEILERRKYAFDDLKDILDDLDSWDSNNE